LDILRDGDTFRARVKGLIPTQFFVAHVIAYDAQGLPTKPSPEVRVQTPKHWFPSLLQCLFAALAVLVALIIRNKWKNRNAPISGF